MRIVSVKFRTSLIPVTSLLRLIIWSQFLPDKGRSPPPNFGLRPLSGFAGRVDNKKNEKIKAAKVKDQFNR